MTRGIIALLTFFGLVVLLLSVVPLPRSVVASGTVASLRESRVIIHDSGGVVSRLPANQGDSVKQGDPIIEFSTDSLEAERTALATEIVVLSAERELLIAADTNGGPVGFSPSLREMAEDFGLQDLLVVQQSRSDAKQVINTELEAQNKEKKRSLTERHRRRIAEKAEKKQELALLEGLIERRVPLVEQGFSAKSDLDRLLIEQASLRGEIERLDGDIEGLANEIATSESDGDRLPNEFSHERLTRLSDLSRQVADKQKRLVLIEQALARSVVRSPVAGQVIELTANTVGSYVSPGQAIALVSPSDEGLVIDVKLNPGDIDAVNAGMSAKVVFSAFPQRALPELSAPIESVTRDVVIDKVTGHNYYHARLSVPREAITHLTSKDHNEITPGMPVDVFIIVNRATALEYFWMPLKHSFRKSFRA